MFKRVRALINKHRFKFIRRNVRSIRRFKKLPRPVKIAGEVAFGVLALGIGVVITIVPGLGFALVGVGGIGAWAFRRVKKLRKMRAIKCEKEKPCAPCQKQARQKVMEKLAMARSQKCLYEHRIRNRYLDYIKAK